MPGRGKMPYLGKYSTDENIRPGLITPKGHVYSGSMMKSMPKAMKDVGRPRKRRGY